MVCGMPSIKGLLFIIGASIISPHCAMKIAVVFGIVGSLFCAATANPAVQGVSFCFP